MTRTNCLANSIAIVVPMYRDSITHDEQISLRHLDYFLPDIPRIIVKPKNLSKPFVNYEIIDFPNSFFETVGNYSKLLLSPIFYETFIAFDYILIYQLDCLIFSSDLEQWCRKGFDYIGAPLFQNNTFPPRISRVGNGGFSIRNVKSSLDVLNSANIPSWHQILSLTLPDLYKFQGIYQWIKKIRVFHNARRGVNWYTKNYTLNEDLFWSDRARLFNPGFTIAPISDALLFSFDRHPRICFEMNGEKLPFGAHAWSKWDRAFWEPHLIC